MAAYAEVQDGGPINEGDAAPPSWFWTLMEGRALLELGALYSVGLLLRRLPRGDGHPVVVLPGFLASDVSTKPLRRILRNLGYEAHGWGLGRNLRFDDDREAEMTALLHRVHADKTRKISLIGWSLGGVFARELAKRAPDKVRSVITLGSPITRHREYSNARHLYDAINGPPEQRRAAQLAQLADAPPVPTTTIFSKNDGVVSWRGAVQPRESGHGETENIAISGSHFGLGVNPLVIYAIADRLAQPEGQWRPFEHAGLRRVFFRRHD